MNFFGKTSYKTTASGLLLRLSTAISYISFWILIKRINSAEIFRIRIVALEVVGVTNYSKFQTNSYGHLITKNNKLGKYYYQ